MAARCSSVRPRSFTASGSAPCDNSTDTRASSPVYRHLQRGEAGPVCRTGVRAGRQQLPDGARVSARRRLVEGSLPCVGRGVGVCAGRDELLHDRSVARRRGVVQGSGALLIPAVDVRAHPQGFGYAGGVAAARRADQRHKHRLIVRCCSRPVGLEDPHDVRVSLQGRQARGRVAHRGGPAGVRTVGQEQRHHVGMASVGRLVERRSAAGLAAVDVGAVPKEQLDRLPPARTGRLVERRASESSVDVRAFGQEPPQRLQVAVAGGLVQCLARSHQMLASGTAGLVRTPAPPPAHLLRPPPASGARIRPPAVRVNSQPAAPQGGGVPHRWRPPLLPSGAAGLLVRPRPGDAGTF